jgi:O-antigen/teichoic acid export membrane protein
LVANVAARVGAIVALGISTIWVARRGGPQLVGVYALLRVLPGLAGVVSSCGLPAAVTFFLAGPDGRERRLRPTIVLLIMGGGLLGSGGWFLLSPVLHRLFFPDISLPLVAFTATAVLTQLLVAVGKSCLQGDKDMPGANWATFYEEAVFVPVYGALVVLGLGGGWLLVLALIASDLIVAAWIALRLISRGWPALMGSPDLRLARAICAFGLRGQVGGVVSLLNLRLDFLLLGGVSGPAVLGAYSVASKYAELLRLPGLAVTYVSYPRFARLSAVEARLRARRLFLPAIGLNVLLAVPLALAASWLLPALYGRDFRSSITPTWILLGGLLGEGLAGLITGYLYGRGKPGLNSLAMGGGLIATLVLDVVLIPRYGAIGAAAASAVAYLLTTATLVWCFWSSDRRARDVVSEQTLQVATP